MREIGVHCNFGRRFGYGVLLDVEMLNPVP